MHRNNIIRKMQGLATSSIDVLLNASDLIICLLAARLARRSLTETAVFRLAGRVPPRIEYFEHFCPANRRAEIVLMKLLVLLLGKGNTWGSRRDRPAAKGHNTNVYTYAMMMESAINDRMESLIGRDCRRRRCGRRILSPLPS